MSTNMVTALVDTGAFASFVDSRNLSPEALAQADSLQRIGVSLADGSTVRTMGTLEISVALGALTIDVKVHVMPTLNKALILGMDFLGRKDLDPAILTARRVLKFCATGQEVPLGRHGVHCRGLRSRGLRPSSDRLHGETSRAQGVPGTVLHQGSREATGGPRPRGHGPTGRAPAGG